MKRYMLDIETMGVRSNSAIVQIGAVEFDDTYFIVDTLTRNVSLQSCIRNGLSVDASTIRWWMEQQNRLEVLDSGIDLVSCLGDLSLFMNIGDGELWVNGASFDPVILENAYYAVGGSVIPWKFWQVRDARTIYNVAEQFGWKPPEKDTAHDALQDCKDQINRLSLAMEFLRNGR